MGSARKKGPRLAALGSPTRRSGRTGSKIATIVLPLVPLALLALSMALLLRRSLMMSPYLGGIHCDASGSVYLGPNDWYSWWMPKSWINITFGWGDSRLRPLKALISPETGSSAGDGKPLAHGSCTWSSVAAGRCTGARHRVSSPSMPLWRCSTEQHLYRPAGPLCAL